MALPDPFLSAARKDLRASLNARRRQVSSAERAQASLLVARRAARELHLQEKGLMRCTIG
ncbi:MAG: hypothetical protein JO173_00805 [Gammaproteobacteria bacterium]|nr:hypothetical protein [Gammaproteobacteria bacterium]